MNITDALQRMRAATDDVKHCFDGYGFEVKTDVFYMDKYFRNLPSHENAKFATATITLSSGSDEDGAEYCMSVGVEIKRGGVDEGKLNEDIASFSEIVSTVHSRFEAAEDKHAVLSELSQEANEEYKKLVIDLRKSKKISTAMNIAFSIGMAVLLLIVLLLR